MEITLLLRLLTAHLLTDFVFRPASWVAERKAKKVKSLKLPLHVFITASTAYIFSGLYTCWQIPLAIFISHYIIDTAKAYLPDNLTFLILDQLMHVLVIAGIWLVKDEHLQAVTNMLYAAAANRNFWLISVAYIFVAWPLGILIGKAIGKATAVWRDHINTSPENKEGLADAGKWIGICERTLILTFILSNQYEGIGFLITAKSLLRFGEKEQDQQKKTEYILVGTLISFAASTLIGVMLVSAMH
ncbi:MAG: DUF3307 domain-containing protein [Bacteroidota bacterium]